MFERQVNISETHDLSDLRSLHGQKAGCMPLQIFNLVGQGSKQMMGIRGNQS